MRVTDPDYVTANQFTEACKRYNRSRISISTECFSSYSDAMSHVHSMFGLAYSSFCQYDFILCPFIYSVSTHDFMIFSPMLLSPILLSFAFLLFYFIHVCFTLIIIYISDVLICVMFFLLFSLYSTLNFQLLFILFLSFLSLFLSVNIIIISSGVVFNLIKLFIIYSALEKHFRAAFYVVV